MIDEKKLILYLNDWMLQESFLRYMKNPADTIGECIKVIEEQPKIDEWIPCSERLPDTRNNILICQSDGYVSVGYFQHCKGFLDLNSILFDNVIAWQPLPEAYHE